MFARFAGTRTLAMVGSDLYAEVDAAHGNAISALSSPTDNPVQPPEEDPTLAHAESLDVPPATEGGVDQGDNESTGSEPQDPLEEVGDPDPSDEIMTANGESMVLLFGLFMDGVQLFAHGRSTTAVVSMKCLDMPGFLANTDLASYTIAFIGGPKEPTTLTTLTRLILDQFKYFEPKGVVGGDGVKKL